MSKENQFMRHVEPTETCWYWMAATSIDGYGQFKYEGSMKKASRVSYILFKGAVKSDQLVCHTCNNRLCVNPDHLYLGTQKDNMIDMAKQRRGTAKLSNDIVLKIKKCLNQGDKFKDIVSKFNISPQTLSSIKTGKTWSWLY